MSVRVTTRLIVAAGYVVLAAVEGFAGGLKLPPVFGDNMVLQSGIADTVWGTANPSATVRVEVAGQEKSATVEPGGKWSLRLDPLRPGGPHVLKVESQGEVKVFNDVLVGEVWICSGQSNMQFTLKDAANAASELPLATNPQLRFYNGRAWMACSPKTAADFSAIGYFFAKELNNNIGLPIGMINVSVGGTSIQQWTPEATLRAIPALKDAAATCDANARLQRDDPTAFQQKKAAVDEARKVGPLDCVANDIGTREKWYSPSARLDNWDPANLPMLSFEEGFSDLGSVWYKREVDIPAAWVGKPLVLNLPGIDDVDISYVNGTEVGRTWYDTCKDFWKVPRHYRVPSELISSNKLSVTLLVLNAYGIGGVFGRADELSLSLADDVSAASVPLAGKWLVHRGTPANIRAKQLGNVSTSLGGGLYNALIAPLQPYGIRGMIWYQAESNADEPELYADMFPAMIKSWRSAWGQGEFPFYFVSLAGFMGHQELAVEKYSWAEIREAQKSGLALPHTGMAMAYDIGEANDIHPKNKSEVGRRLAALALANDYGLRIESQGPTLERMEIDGDRVRLHLSHAMGMAPKGSELRGFAIAGSDKVFHFARASIQDAVVVLSAADGLVQRPVAVRYGWSSIPSGNLYNSAGFPAVPFRTDKWSVEEIGTTGPGCR